jgi:hypothetical protein
VSPVYEQSSVNQAPSRRFAQVNGFNSRIFVKPQIDETVGEQYIETQRSMNRSDAGCTQEGNNSLVS